MTSSFAYKGRTKFFNTILRVGDVIVQSDVLASYIRSRSGNGVTVAGLAGLDTGALLAQDYQTQQAGPIIISDILPSTDQVLVADSVIGASWKSIVPADANVVLAGNIPTTGYTNFWILSGDGVYVNAIDQVVNGVNQKVISLVNSNLAPGTFSNATVELDSRGRAILGTASGPVALVNIQVDSVERLLARIEAGDTCISLRAGEYVFNTSLVISSSLTLMGDKGAIFKSTGSGNIIFSATPDIDISISGIIFDMENNSTEAITVKQANSLTVSECSFINGLSSIGVWGLGCSMVNVYGCSFDTATNSSIAIKNTTGTNLQVQDCFFNAWSGSSIISGGDNLVKSCFFVNSGGVVLSGGRCEVSGNIMKTSGGVFLNGNQNVVDSNMLYRPTQDAISILNGTGGMVSNNMIYETLLISPRGIVLVGEASVNNNSIVSINSGIGISIINAQNSLIKGNRLSGATIELQNTSIAYGTLNAVLGANQSVYSVNTVAGMTLNPLNSRIELTSGGPHTVFLPTLSSRQTGYQVLIVAIDLALGDLRVAPRLFADGTLIVFKLNGVSALLTWTGSRWTTNGESGLSVDDSNQIEIVS